VESRSVTRESLSGVRPPFGWGSNEVPARGGIKGDLVAKKIQYEKKKTYENPLCGHDPGVDPSFARFRVMDPARNGGNQGGSGEAPTHPMFLVGTTYVSLRSLGSSPAFRHGGLENGGTRH
jgi:hypothetical protein